MGHRGQSLGLQHFDKGITCQQLIEGRHNEQKLLLAEPCLADEFLLPLTFARIGSDQALGGRRIFGLGIRMFQPGLLAQKGDWFLDR